MVFQSAPNQTFYVNKNPMANYKVQSMFNGDKYINVAGALNLGAPRMGDMKLDIQYTGSPNNQSMDIRKVDGHFITKGNVHFYVDTKKEKNIEIKDGSGPVNIHGIVREEPKTFNEMPVTLIAQKISNANTYEIKIKDNWTHQLSVNTGDAMGWNGIPKKSSEGFSIPGVTGGTIVDGDDWGLFTFVGNMADNAHPEGDGFEKNPKMKFTVKGDIEVNSGELKLSGMDTPFGEFNTAYDFKKGILVGSLTIKTQVSLVPLIIKKGTIEFRNDRNGFYIVGAMDTELTIPLINGNYQLGFMAGNYRDTTWIRNHVWPIATRYKDELVKNDCFINLFVNTDQRNGLKGFFFTVDRKLFDLDFPYYYPPVTWGKVWGKGVIGSDIFMTFSPFATGVVARLDLQAGGYLQAITGTSISGGIRAAAAIAFIYAGQFQVNADLQLLFKLTIEQFPFGEVFNKNLTCKAGIHIPDDGFSFSLGEGNGFDECASYGSNLSRK
jgi:hypothetical protein